MGRDQMLLTICLLVYPEAEADELAVFIVDHGGDVYSRSVISRRMSEMLSTMKSASSTEAYQAFTPRNLLRERLFWTNPLPLGINGVFRRLFIDVDECGIALERCNRKKGHGMTGLRLRKPGHYTRDTKLTILIAIEPGNLALAAHIDCSDHFRGNESSRFQHQRVERPDDSKKSPTSATASTRHHSNITGTCSGCTTSI